MLTQAITLTLESICRDRFNILAPDALPVSFQEDTKLRPNGYTRNSHNFIELVQLVEGKALLETSSRPIKLCDSDCWLIQPHAIHAETYARAQQPYKLLWIAFTQSGINFFISTYTPKTGFQVQMERLYCLIDQLKSLWELASRENLKDSKLARAEFQALMIQALLAGLSQIEIQRSGQFDHQKVLVGQVHQYIEHHFSEPISIDELSQMARCTPNYLNGLFRKYFNQPIHQYILQKRLEAARRLLSEKQIAVKEVAYKLGFSDPLYFSRLFRKRFGIPPTDFSTSAKYSKPE